MRVPKKLEPLLRLVLWLLRPKYLVGVFPVCIRSGCVLLINKRLGAATGWQLPGGAKEYGVPLEESACEELAGETGLTTEPRFLRLVRLQCIEHHRDINVAFLVTQWSGTVGPRDTTEISEARWVPFTQAKEMLYPT